MEPWIAATIAAAFFQAIRFALQKRLTGPAPGGAGLSASGATWARFLWAAPFMSAGLFAWLWASQTPLPALPAVFWAYAVAGGLSQILATICVVALFSLRAFAVGLTFKKSEVLQTALLGWLVLGDGVTLPALLALVAGFGALALLSVPSGEIEPRAGLRAMALGLASGAFFAGAGVGYRGATLALDGDPALRAAVALALVTGIQTLVMALWFAGCDRAQAKAVLRAWRPGLLVGITSLAGSFGWFFAFTQQNAAYVFALGQVELVFGLILGVWIFGERPAPRELVAMALLVASLVALVAVI